MVSKGNIENKIEKSMFMKKEKCLIDFLFGEKYKEDIIRTFFDELDINTANQNYILQLSCLGYLNNWKFFPQEMIPRLKGIHRYYQVLNANGIPWLIQQIRILSDAGISVMLVKGLAMRAYYAPDTPRIMWDYDIAVPEAQYRKSVDLLCGAGGVIRGECLHSSAITNGKDEIDLHRWVFKANEEKETDFWERAVHFNFHGVEVCVPSPVDMFIHQLDTQTGDYFSSVPLACTVKRLYDFRCMVSMIGDFNLIHIAARAKELHAENQVRLALRQYIKYFPDLIKESSFNKAFPLSKEYYKWIKNGQRCKKELKKYRELCKIDRTDGTMALIYYMHMIRLELARYHYYKWRMNHFGQNLSLLQFFKDTKKVDHFLEAIVYMLKKMREVCTSDSR